MAAITERAAVDLAAAIRRGDLSAADVVEAHIDRHVRWGPRINALVAERFDQARAEAAAADARVAKATAGAGGDSDGAGCRRCSASRSRSRSRLRSAGCRSRPGWWPGARSALRQARRSSRRLIDAGAIPLGVTNTSELTLWIESTNNVYGRTSNPYDTERTAGGSSGGEGAAVGCGGSPFGVAADIAGSIRVPAFFCGVFGHKPSSGLVPNSGMYPPTPGDAGRMLGTGPIARRAQDLMPLLRVIAGPDGLDPLVRPATLGDPGSVSLRGLRVTTVENSSVLPMSRELRDARERAVGALAAAGADLHHVELRSWRRGLLPYLATLQSGAPQTTIALLTAAGIPAPTWRTLARRRGPHTVQTRLTLAAEMLPQLEGKALQRQLDAGLKLAAELAEAIGDGVLLHPAQPSVAPRHGRTLGRPWLLTPAAMFNLAGVPVTEVPLGLSADDLPLGVQVAAGLGRDDVAIAVAIELERVFGGWKPPT